MIMILNTFRKKLIATIIIFGVIEFLSYLGFLFPWLNQGIGGLLVIGILILTIYKLEYGLMVVLSELLLGSFGYLFYWPIMDYKLSLRFVLWTVVLIIFLIKFLFKFLRKNEPNIYWQRIKNFSLLKYFGLLFLLIIIGLITGLWQGFELTTIFLDFNAWLYFLLLFPVLAIYGQLNQRHLERLKLIFGAAVIVISLKTIFLLFVFTHSLEVSGELYLWLRQNLIGEMTPTANGWPRIFIQSQIFPIIGFFLLFWFNRARLSGKEFFQIKNLWSWSLACLFISIAIISFSRSFWVGLLAAGLFSLVLVWIIYSFKKMLGILSWSISTFLGGLLLIYLVVIFPYPQPGKFTADFIDRVSNNQEAALASRWSLLPVLSREIIREPFLGQGFGATITYISSDPRVLANHPSGEYTTYAFEWGYLDIALKIGILGVLVYLLLLGKLIQQGITKKTEENNYLKLGLSAGLVFLMVINIFTPYLNHPLGIGFLILSSCLISQDRVY